MEKIIKIVSTPFDPSIEIVGNISLHLHAPYSDNDVTIQINPNIEEYIVNEDNENSTIRQLTITSNTANTKTLAFDFKEKNIQKFFVDNETYEIKLLNIGKQNFEGQDFQYFEFLVRWDIIISDETPGGAIKLKIFPQENTNHPEQCIVDIGEKGSLGEKRISLIINSDFSLVGKLLDLRGQSFEILQELSENWKKDSWIEVIFSWNSKQMKLRTQSDSDGANYFEKSSELSEISLFHMWENPPCVIGCDLENKRFSKMKLEYITMYSSSII